MGCAQGCTKGGFQKFMEQDEVKKQDKVKVTVKFCTGSVTDEGRTSFANKSMQQDVGDEPKKLGLGYTCRKGLKPDTLNQNSWCVLQVEAFPPRRTFSIYAVFNGHGRKGEDISNFVKDNLPRLIIDDPRFGTKEMPQMLMDKFNECQGLVCTADSMNEFDAKRAGTTASVVVHNNTTGEITTAHVGDCTVVLGSKSDDLKEKTTGRALTRDHFPDLPDEKAHIEKNGGRVVFDGYAKHRVWAKDGKGPGLNLSRCLGDILSHQDCGIRAEPEISNLSLRVRDHVLLVCSSGIWQFLMPADAVALVSQYPEEKAQMAADLLAKRAWDRWIEAEGGAVVADLTVVVVYLEQVGYKPQ